jgi:hypothetical protein
LKIELFTKLRDDSEIGRCDSEIVCSEATDKRLKKRTTGEVAKRREKCEKATIGKVTSMTD